jgi:2'-5' RNA ligase
MQYVDTGKDRPGGSDALFWKQYLTEDEGEPMYGFSSSSQGNSTKARPLFWIADPVTGITAGFAESLAAKAGALDFGDSVMVAFFLPIDTVPKLETMWPEGSELLPSIEHHVTLVYLGSAADLQQAGIYPEHLLVVLRAFADKVNTPVLTGMINGWGRFNGDEADAVYLNFDAPDLPKFRQALVDELSTLLPVASSHGYTPHITIGYVPKGEPVNMLEMPAMIKIAFDTLTLAWGGVYYPVPLSKQTADSDL